MPRKPACHYNPPDSGGVAACGRKLRGVKDWTEEPSRTTCVNCLKAMKE